MSEHLRPRYAGFGVDLPKRNGDDSFELPVPGTFVVDRNGIVRDAFVDPDYNRSGWSRGGSWKHWHG